MVLGERIQISCHLLFFFSAHSSKRTELKVFNTSQEDMLSFLQLRKVQQKLSHWLIAKVDGGFDDFHMLEGHEVTKAR
jgi:hypothetical protein